MEILQGDNGSKGKFFIHQDDEDLAAMHYVWAGSRQLIIDHTEVSDKLRGQGAGKQMLEKLVEFAREKGIKVTPLCPFARSVFDKTPELRDVL